MASVSAGAADYTRIVDKVGNLFRHDYGLTATTGAARNLLGDFLAATPLLTPEEVRNISARQATSRRVQAGGSWRLERSARG
jgi:hypothetical protein